MNSKPRLLEVTKAFYPVIGGIEKTVYDLAVLASDEFDVTVLAVSEDRSAKRESYGAFEVVKVPKLAKVFSAPLSLGYPSKFAELVRQTDVTHLHSPYPLAELSLWLHPVRTKVAVTYHFDIVRQKAVEPFYAPLLHATLRRADRIIATNPNSRATSPFLRRYDEKVTVIPSCGVEPESYRLTPEQRSAAERLRGRHARPLVLFVGRLVYYKGAEYLVRAMSDVNADLVIVGSGRLEPSLKALAREVGAEARIQFLPHIPRDELFQLFHACDLFVLPSVAKSEGFGLVLLEAMACGKPLVTTELGTGTSWINQNGETGFVVPPRDAGALAEAIRRLVSDEPLRRTMGQAAYERVCRVFTRKAFGESYIRLFKELLAAQTVAPTDRPPAAKR
jgi:rhamnosyl/mannosyltransferase